MRINFADLVLYEDNHLLVVFKPSGILSQLDNSKDECMVDLAKNYLKEKYQKPGNVYVGLVHRLDRMTEGVLVLTKTSKAASRLSEDIRFGKWEKTYLCLVEGIINADGRLTDYLTKIEDTKKMKVLPIKESANGQLAKLSYQVVKKFDNETLLKVYLETGRHHQIRVQMANFKHPLVGDLLYGNSKIKKDLFLACIKIKFKHPTLDKMIEIEALPRSAKWNKYLKGD